jgi:tRNA(adenine34) deaminase
MGVEDTFWMKQAYALALKANAQSEVPVGAILVLDNKLIGRGYNQVIQNHDPCAHAEILAIRAAALAQSNYRLEKSTLYVTLEPCSMCAGAIVHARIERVVFACRDFKAGAAGSVFNLLKGYPLNHQVIIDEGPLTTECSELLKAFFNSRR